MHNSRQLLATGIQFHNRGELDRASQYYRQVLALEPRNPDALHLEGLVLLQRNQPDEAARMIKKAIKANGRVADFHNNLGEALRRLGKLADARKALQKALALDARHVRGLNNLGLVCQALGQASQAAGHFRKALTLQPDYPEAHLNLAQLLMQEGRSEEALEHFEQADTLPQAWLPRGNLLRREGRLEEALACFEKCLARNPSDLAALANRGECQMRLGRLDEAETTLQGALSLSWENAALHNSLGAVQLERGDIPAALNSFENAVSLEPDYLQARLNLGMVLRESGQVGPALDAYDQALANVPDSAEAHFGRALTLLTAGDWQQGWAEYEWRWRAAYGPRMPELGSPRWEGEDHPGDHLLLLAEQGLGDCLQFVRYALPLAGRFARISLRAPAKLHPLLAQLPGLDALLDETEELPVHDWHCPLLSLPGLLGVTPENQPVAAPYLNADSSRSEYWRSRLEALGEGLKVGLCWGGSRSAAQARARQRPPQSLGTLLDCEGVHWVSLQFERGEELDAALEGRGGLLHDWMDEAGPFAEMAALIASLDLVIVADTVVAHLAGALGAPCWTLVPYCQDWRWLRERTDTPWYGSMRLFRQNEIDDWQPVIDDVTADLTSRVNIAEASIS